MNNRTDIINLRLEGDARVATSHALDSLRKIGITRCSPATESTTGNAGVVINRTTEGAYDYDKLGLFGFAEMQSRRCADFVRQGIAAVIVGGSVGTGTNKMPTIEPIGREIRAVTQRMRRLIPYGDIVEPVVITWDNNDYVVAKALERYMEQFDAHN